MSAVLGGMLALSIGLWALALAYGLKLAPPFARRWHPGAALGLVLLAIAVSFGSYRAATRVRREEQAQKYYHAGLDEVQRGDLTQAKVEFEKARSLQPGHPGSAEELRKLEQSQKPAEKREQHREAKIDPKLKPAPAPAPSANAPAGSSPSPAPGAPGEKPKPAPHKPSPFEIIHYALDVDLDPAAHSLDAIATIRVKSRGEEVPTLDFSLNPEFKPVSAQVEGAAAAVRHTNDLLAVTPHWPLGKGAEATVTITYRRHSPNPLVEGGDLISTSGSYLRSEARWYPATGELDFRAPVRVRARVPAGYTAVSVGALKGVEKEGKTTRFHWETDRPASMVSLAAARYVKHAMFIPARDGPTPNAQHPTPNTQHPTPNAQPGLEVSCYTFPEHRNRASLFLKEAAAIVRFYTQRFGPYPYEKLAVVEIPLFPGGYGTTSFVMLIDRSFAAKKPDREFLAHEIAHQWWGNSVFPQGLGAAWLTEAFANYSAWMYASARAGNPRVLTKRVEEAGRRYFRATKAKGDQPIAETDPYQPVGASEQILYEKGAVVLHMLRQEMGDESFRRLLRDFADEHRFGKARIEDFRRLAERDSGQQLGWFFEQWLGRTGALDLSYTFETRPKDARENDSVVTVTQAGAPYRAKMKVVLDIENSVRTHEIELTEKRQEFHFPVRGKLTNVLFDPESTYLMKPPRWVVIETAKGGP